MKHSELTKTLVASLAVCLGVMGLGQLGQSETVFAKKTDNGKVEKFDKYKGHQVYEYTVQNKSGLKVSVLSQGGTLHGIYVPKGAKDKRNIIMSFKHTKQYYSKAAKSLYVGQQIGPVGNRIRDGKFKLDGKTVSVPTNENGNTLHSGKHGYNSVRWKGKVGTYHGNPAITLRHTFSSKYTGFPGKVKATTRYVVTDDNQVKVLMSAKSTKDTVFDPTIHAYFNLGQEKTIRDQELTMNSTQRLELNKEKVPTGNLLENKGTYDFTQPKALGSHLDHLITTKEQGFDTMFKVKPDKNDQIAKLSDPKTDRSVTFLSKRNGMVVYSGNSITKKVPFESGAGRQHAAIALEPQMLPDAVNHPSFGDVSLKAGQTKTKEITYKIDY
ncbi:aldose 1-epimerase [Ligilactobacillus salitolerans]|uniref:Aldose 1-epimerase n=1 Tax=Ligilactobacillus salitolerans TaxID=1808352 RepID=A0A401IRP1_9LACO|nr:aldose epimerase family protein [Ligilactobacillus salitolerans]GBG94186.1 aldose 1-epimerase [Ligilactobacillus salitolerans]